MTAVIHELLSSVMGVIVESVVSELSKHLSDFTTVLSEQYKNHKGSAGIKNKVKQANQVKTVSSTVRMHAMSTFYFIITSHLLFVVC